MKRCEFQQGVMIPVSFPRERSKGFWRLTHFGQLAEVEGLFCLDSNVLEEKSKDIANELKENYAMDLENGNAVIVNLNWGTLEQWKMGMRVESSGLSLGV